MIPIHRTHAIGKQLLPGRHIIRIIRITQPLGHIQIKPRMTIKPVSYTHLDVYKRQIQGSRYDYDGGPFYWQYDFIIPLGIPNPIAPAAFGRPGYRVMDTLCFEGGLFLSLIHI